MFRTATLATALGSLTVLLIILVGVTSCGAHTTTGSTAGGCCSTNTIEFIPDDPAVAPMCWACDGPHFISVVNMLRETLAMVVPKEGEEIPHADEVERHARHGCQWYHKGDQCGYTYTYRGRTLTKTKTGLSSGAALSTLNHQLILEKQPQQGQYPGARFTEKPGVKQRGTRGVV
jgi:hypothetical protein